MDPISDDLLFDLMQINSESQAIIYHDKDLVVNYDELNKIILKKIYYLLDNNIQPGSNTVLKVKDPWIDLQNFLALTYIGSGVYCPLGNSELEKDIVRCIGADFTISDSLDFAWTENIINADITYYSDSVSNFDRYKKCCDLYNLDRPLIIQSTSGTTGRPKIFKIIRKDVLSRRMRYFDAVGIKPGDLFFSLTPMRFSAARWRIYYNLTAGGRVLFINEKTEIKEVIRLINFYRVSHLFCVALHLENLCRYAELNHYNADRPLFPYLKSIEATSSLISSVLRERVMVLLTKNLIITYATTEVGHITSTRKSGNNNLSLNDVGAEVKEVNVGIYDKFNATLPDESIGRIGISISGFRFDGYCSFNDTANKRDSSDIFFPGDLGYISKNKNLIFQGREDDMMIFNGINIYPYEIESALKSLPEVYDAVAFPLPSTVHYQIPCAAVILKINVDDFNVLLSRCRDLIGARAPQYLFFVKDFPRNQTGKVLRKELQKIVINSFYKKK